MKKVCKEFFIEWTKHVKNIALIALAVAHALKCPYCIDAYTKTCLEKGLTRNR